MSRDSAGGWRDALARAHPALRYRRKPSVWGCVRMDASGSKINCPLLPEDTADRKPRGRKWEDANSACQLVNTCRYTGDTGQRKESLLSKRGRSSISNSRLHSSSL